MQPVQPSRNWPLVWGLAISGTLLAVALLYPLVFPYPAQVDPVTIRSGSAGVEIASAPYPPSWQRPLGTDQWGRDLLQRLLFGGRLTLAAALLSGLWRMALAVPLGLWAARSRWVEWLVEQGVAVTSAFPAVLFVLVLSLPMPWYRSLPALPSAALLVLLVTLVGVPRAAATVARRSQEVLA